MTRMRALFVLATLALVVCTTQALYTAKDDVILATDATFQSIVLDSPKPSIVEFFAPWCGHCKSLAPEYKQVATKLKGLINVVAVDCDAQTGRALAGRYGIQGFPTIKIFSPDSTTPEDYQGQRSAAAIANAGIAKLGTKNIKKVTAKTIEEFLGDAQPKGLLFTSKTSTTPLYKALSYEFKGRMILGEVQQKETELVNRFGVKTFPTFLIIKNDEAKTQIPFDGEYSHATLSAFISQHALPPVKKASTGGSKTSGTKKEKESAKPTAPPAPPKVWALEKEQDFEEQCVNKRAICALAFLPPKELDEEQHAGYLKVLDDLLTKRGAKDAFSIMWVDGTKATNFRKELDLAVDLPAFVLVSPHKKRYTPFIGAFAPDSMSSFMDKVLQGKKSIARETLPPLFNTEPTATAPNTESSSSQTEP